MPDRGGRWQNGLMLAGGMLMILGGLVGRRYPLAVVGLVIAAVAMRRRRST